MSASTPLSAAPAAARRGGALLLAAVALAVAGCGGGSGTGSSSASPAPTPGANTRVLSCAADARQPLPGGGELINNAWNAGAAGSDSWSQCLQQRDDGAGGTQFGWSWRWPEVSRGIYAYPSVMVGAKPWFSGPGNDRRLPRALSALPAVVLDWDVETTSSGQYNLAASMWFIRTPQVAAPPVEQDITTEMMIWSDYAPSMISGSGGVTLRGEIEIDGRRWQVWAAESWGDLSGASSHRWRFIVYTARDRTPALRVDARRFIDDAIARGLLAPDQYLAAIELGNEVASGSGSSWVRRFEVSGF